MVFNRHLKALNLCNHSDTIACVLYELLVNLELIIVGFQTHVQGSTSFSFVQFSRSCCAAACFVTACILYLIKALLSRTFFDIFLKPCGFKIAIQAVGTGFSGCALCETAWLLQQGVRPLSRTFFGFFYKVWGAFLDKVYIVGLLWGGHYVQG